MSDDLLAPRSAQDLQRALESLEDFFENGVVGLHLVAGDGTILRANRAELDLLGYAPNEYLGRKIAEFHADPAVIDDILVRLSRGEALDRYPARLKHKDGSVRHVLISSSALFRGGEFINTRCFTVDVTQQVEAEAALKAEQARLALAVHTAAVGVWDWDIDTNAMVYSPEAKAIFGFDPEKPVTFEMVRDATHPDDYLRTWPMAQRALDPKVREKAPYEYRAVRPDGEIRWVLAHGEAIFDGDGPEAKPLRYVGAIQDITQRRDAALALETSQTRLKLAMDAALMAVWDTEVGSRMDLAPSLASQLGLAPKTAVTLEELRARYLPGEQARVQAAALAAFEAGERTFEAEYRYRRSDDSTGWLLVRAEFERRPDGAPPKAVGVLIDISERKAVEDALRQSEERLQALNATLEERIASEVAERSKAEEALRQAQKMEAVGQLTGGVAHDFNNLLTVIIGGLDTILRAKPGDEARVRRAALMALNGAERAASLTTRLLAFSRRQPLNPKPADLNVLMRSLTEMLHRTLGETIELEGVLSPRLWPVEVDANQLENAILNLALNARDAMPEGGKLTIETANASLDESYRAKDAEVLPGQYVMVSVSDTGSGMSSDTAARVFEPFFTTKEVGKGTGLGLSMVYGFVKQSGGHVGVYSEPGHGTTLKLYFPRFVGEADQPAGPAPLQAPRGHEDEVILVVEDNEDVRAYSTMVLTELGYSVVEAVDAETALSILREDRQIDLLFTDVVLPGKSGRELATAAAKLRPGLPVLFTTGYSRNAIVHHGRLDPGVNLLNKPFTFDQLAGGVRDVLDGQHRRSPKLP
jgi:PAS domain S-box-containing protein